MLYFIHLFRRTHCQSHSPVHYKFEGIKMINIWMFQVFPLSPFPLLSFLTLFALTFSSLPPVRSRFSTISHAFVHEGEEWRRWQHTVQRWGISFTAGFAYFGFCPIWAQLCVSPSQHCDCENVFWLSTFLPLNTKHFFSLACLYVHHHYKVQHKDKY